MSGRCGDERPVILVVEADALAGTAGRCKLALDREARAIVEALGPRAHRRFDVRVVQAATIEDVMHAILEWRPMILHFAAHAVPAATEASRGAGEQRNIVPPGLGAGAGSGSGESGAILLVDDHGAPQPVPGAALANVLAVADSPIRLLVLATCEGEAIADAVRHQVDAVIGFEGGLQDRAAPSLAELYWGLGRGQPLGQAYRQAVAILAVKYPFERVIHRVRPGLTLDDIVLAPSPHPSPHPSPRRLGRLRRTAGCLAFVLLAATAGAAVGRLIDVIDARGSMRPISKPIEPELTDSRVPQWEDAEWRHQPPSPLPPAPPEPPVPPVPRAQVAPPAPRALRRVAPPDRAQLHLALPAPAQLAPVETAPRPIARPPVAPPQVVRRNPFVGGQRIAQRAEPETRETGPSALGDLDMAIVGRYVARSRDKVRHCYELQLAVAPDPSLSFTATARFIIAADGSVQAVTVDGLDAKVSRCVAAAVSAIRFPRNAGDLHVNYPFHFVPR